MIIRKFLAVLLALMFLIGISSANIIEAEGNSSKEGYAFAVLDGDGNLVFFRSKWPYINKNTGTFVDLEGNEYTGTVYADFEDYPYGNLWNFDGDPSDPDCRIVHEYWGDEEIKTVRIAEGQSIHPASTYSWFHMCDSIESIDLTGLDTSAVTDMSMMFFGCSSLTELNISGFDTSNVTLMDSMFDNCKALKSLDLSHFDTSKVISMSSLFCGCSKLESLDISGFDTGNTINIGGMFCGCLSLTSADVSNFNTSKVIILSDMFENCPLMERLDLSNFDTHNVMEMVSMFEGCISLKELDISSFDTGNVFEKADGTEEEFSGLLNMFQSCPSLENIHLGSTFSWYPDAGLPSGNWTNGSVTYTVGGLYDNWDVSLAGVWSREITPVLHAVEYLAGLVKCQSLD